MFAFNKNTNEPSFVMLGDSVSALHHLAIESGVTYHMECVDCLRQDFKELIPDWQKYDRFLSALPEVKLPFKCNVCGISLVHPNIEEEFTSVCNGCTEKEESENA